MIRSDALVFFGPKGDLAHKKIFPARHVLIGIVADEPDHIAPVIAQRVVGLGAGQPLLARLCMVTAGPVSASRSSRTAR